MAKYVKTEQGYKEIEAINSNKMDKNNPVGTGSFSMGRKYGSLIGLDSHAEGNNTTASGPYSHAEGYITTASGSGSHAEGYRTTASGVDSHAEGISTTASGEYSHAEGSYTTASGFDSHAEGYNTTASGSYSHAEGVDTAASGNYSHAEGANTTASGSHQHVQGKYNVVDSQHKYAHIVGNGTNNSARSNAHTLDWNGVPWFKGRPQFGGTAQDQGSQTVMANGDKEIILASSTANSTKKFKITVDDDYNVSTTNTSDSVSKTLATTEYVDSSVSKSNPLNITGATVGQIAKITAVDNTGKPTAWEAVDMPSGGGGGDEWELIYYGEITGDIGSVIVDKDSNGNDFSLKEYKLIIKTVAATENPNSGFSWYWHNDDSGTKGPFYTISGAHGGKTLVFTGKLCGSCWYCQYISDNGSTAAQIMRNELCPDGGSGPSAVPVYKLTLSANAGNTCGTGSKVALFGVRA